MSSRLHASPRGYRVALTYEFQTPGVILYGKCGTQRWGTDSPRRTEELHRSPAVGAVGRVALPAGWEDLRATDEARERTAATLRDALVDGSLDVEETEHRLAVTYTARHNRELTALVADLPQRYRAAVSSNMARSQRGPRWPIALLFAALVIAWSLALGFGSQHGVWPVWPLAFILLRTLWWHGGRSGGRRGSVSRPPARSVG
jgi:hypothetical protein